MNGWLEIVVSNVVLASALTALAALTARLLPQRPALVHVLCVLALLKLVTPPVLSVPILPAADAAPVRAPAATLPPPDLLPEELLLLAQQPELSATAEPPAPTSWILPDVTTGVLAVWLLGSLLVLAAVVRRSRRFQRILREARRPSAGLVAEVAQLSARLGLRRPPAVALVDGRVSPLIWPSLRRLHLVLPARLLRELLPAQRTTLLLHELAHARRGDHWIRRLETAASVAFWWLPTLWWLRRCLHQAEEQACDAWVIWAAPAHERAYADTLLSTIDFLSESRFALPPQASGAGHVHQLKQRLTMIMEANAPRRLSMTGRLAALATAVMFLPVLPTRAQEPEPRPPARSTQETLQEALERISQLESQVERMHAEKKGPAAAPEDETPAPDNILPDLSKRDWEAAGKRYFEALLESDPGRAKKARAVYDKAIAQYSKLRRDGELESALQARQKAMHLLNPLAQAKVEQVAARQAEVTAKVIEALKNNDEARRYINPEMLADNIRDQVKRELNQDTTDVRDALRLLYSTQRAREADAVNKLLPAPDSDRDRDRSSRIEALQTEIAELQQRMKELQVQLKKLQQTRKDV